MIQGERPLSGWTFLPVLVARVVGTGIVTVALYPVLVSLGRRLKEGGPERPSFPLDREIVRGRY